MNPYARLSEEEKRLSANKGHYYRNKLDDIKHKILQCKRCNEVLTEDCFSKRQVLRTHSIKNPGPFCKNCVKKLQIFRVCNKCGDKKPVEKFTKNQLKNKDGAHCIACITGISDNEEEDEAEMEETKRKYDLERNTVPDFPFLTTVPTRIGRDLKKIKIFTY